MNKTVDIQRLEFVLAVKDQNSAILNPEFLKDSGIVPVDWELAQPPARTEDKVLVAFQNGVYILHQSNLVAFLENTSTKTADELEVPQLVHRYLKRFPQVNYQAVGMNLEGYTTFDTKDRARSYLLETLLMSNHRHESDQDIVQAVTNFTYRLDHGLLTLTIRNTVLELSEAETLPVILFPANFHRDIAEIPQAERLHILSQIIANWETDVERYQDIVNERFLSKPVGQLV
jgi:hypothetical protein